MDRSLEELFEKYNLFGEVAQDAQDAESNAYDHVPQIDLGDLLARHDVGIINIEEPDRSERA